MAVDDGSVSRFAFNTFNRVSRVSTGTASTVSIDDVSASVCAVSIGITADASVIDAGD